MRVFRPSVLLFLIAAVAAGQQAPFVPITGPGEPKGIQVLFEDSRGGLWLGGDGALGEGLTYFDGSRFVSPVKNFPKVLVTGLEEDSEGGIWIASSGGLYRFSKGRLNPQVITAAAVGITQIAPDVFLASLPGGDLWGNNTDLVRISRVQGSWHVQAIIKSAPLARFKTARWGDVLYPCEGGFCKLSANAFMSWHPGTALSVEHHPVSSPLYGPVSRDRSGCVWMSSGAIGMVQCPGDVRPNPLPLGVGGIGLQPILELQDGSVVIASMGALAIGRPGSFRVITRANGYPSVQSTLLTKDGCIWLSNAEGLFVFPTHSKEEFWTERDGFDANTWSLVRVGKNVLAAAGNRVLILDDDRSRWRPLLTLGAGRHLLAGPNNTVLAGNGSVGVLQINLQGKILRTSEATNAGSLAQTPDGQIWLPGSSAFTKLSFSGQRLRLIPVNIPNSRDDATDIEVDRSGGLWACSGGGLIHKLTAGSRLLSKKDGLLGNECRAFAFDKSGDIWYAYNSTKRFSLIRNPTAAKPLIQHFWGGDAGIALTTFVGSDRRGWLWRGTGDGIYVADLEQARRGEWLHLDSRDGLPSTDSNTRSFFEDSDGSIWFGAGSTVTHLFPPADLVHPKYSPSVFVSGFSWNGGAFQLANLVDDIEHGADIIAHIGSLQFDRRNALRLRYRLLPEQTSWTLERNLDIGLGKLPWGQHTLEAQARLFTGPWSTTVNKSFTILKPLWLQWPALLGFAFAGGCAAAGGLSWRKKRRRRAETELPGLADWRLTVLTPEMGGLEGTVLDGRFEVSRILARGGFATVFEGRDVRSGQPCAVKIFRHELTEKSWMARRFQQEVSALQQIHHANVVGIYGHGNAPNGAPYLAMELIAGRTLREVLNKTKLDRLQTANYLRQAGSALAEIHSHQICHRDLKPENFMIRDSAVPDADLVLIDFSIAIVQDPDETLHGLSRAAGTLQYMAPEQAIGCADASSDIYSLAKILLEMLSGQRLSALLPDASMDLPARIRDLLNTTSYALSAASIDLIAQALEFDPSRRPNRASEFTSRISQDLEAAVNP